MCHIKSPFLLLLKVHSKHQDRGRDCAWQHCSQASRKIAALLPVSVILIQVQPALWDVWDRCPRGLLKQSAPSLLCCSSIVNILLVHVCVYFFLRWLVTWRGWTGRWRDGDAPIRERRRRRNVQGSHISYGKGRISLGVSVNPTTFSLSQSGCTPHPNHITHLKSCCLLNSRIYSFTRCFVPLGSHRVEPLGGSGCGSSLALQDLSQWH